MKFCKDCRYVNMSGPTGVPTCSHQAVRQMYDENYRVYGPGSESVAYCVNVRRDAVIVFSPCGPSGALWEARLTCEVCGAPNGAVHSPTCTLIKAGAEQE